jgi:hypothetical protein
MVKTSHVREFNNLPDLGRLNGCPSPQSRLRTFARVRLPSVGVWSKYSTGRFSAKSRMMYAHHAKQKMGTVVDLCNRSGKRAVAAAKRIPGSREPDLAITPSRPSQAPRSGAIHPAEIGKRLGRRGLEQVAGVARPDTVLAWYRRLIFRKFDGPKRGSYPGRPPIDGVTEALIVRSHRELELGIRSDLGTLANLGYPVSDQTVANVLRR